MRMVANMRLLATVVLLVGGLAMATTACGGSSGGGQPAGSTKVSLTEFSFTPKDLSVTAGKVTFYLVNTGTTAHDFVINDSSGKKVAGSQLVSPGDSFVFTVDNLPAGSYKTMCSVPGHADSGMVGTVTAK